MYGCAMLLQRIKTPGSDHILWENSPKSSGLIFKKLYTTDSSFDVDESIYKQQNM